MPPASSAGTILFDDFASGLSGDWTHHNWNTVNGYLIQSEIGVAPLRHDATWGVDTGTWFLYANGDPNPGNLNDYLDFYPRGHLDTFSQRHDDVGIRIYADSVALRAPDGAGVMTTYDLNPSSITTAEDTFYYVYVEVIGQTMAVWRGETPETMELVLEAGPTHVPATTESGFEATYGQFAVDISGINGWYCLDDVAVIEYPAARVADVEFYYDALGRRIEKRANGEVTRYLHHGPRIIEEMVGGVSNATYVYGDYIDDRILMTRAGVDYYYHTDDMYNVMALTDNAGAVVERYEYGDVGAPEFYAGDGAPLATNESIVGNPYLFNGRRWDAETSLYHYRSRCMDPRIGRFTTRDTIGIWADSANRGNPKIGSEFPTDRAHPIIMRYCDSYNSKTISSRSARTTRG